MITITFPDGQKRQYEEGSSALDIAKSISHGLAKKVISAKVNGEVWEATRPIRHDARLQREYERDTARIHREIARAHRRKYGD